MLDRSSFQPQRPDRFNFVRDVMGRWAAEQPDAAALHWTGAGAPDRILSFLEMMEAAGKAASVLAEAGVGRGDTVLVILSKELPWWELMLGSLQLGAVVSPGTTQLTVKDIAYRLDASDAKAVVTTSHLAEKVEAATRESARQPALLLVDGERRHWIDYRALLANILPMPGIAETAADYDALCYFTSGTTGYPKMTMHAHSYPLGHESTGRFWLDLKPGDLHWNLSDTGWTKAAWSSLFGPWMCGATVFVNHQDGFLPGHVLDLLETYPISTLCAPPTAYRMLVQEDLAARKPMALRHCVSAGEPLNPEVIGVWKAGTGLDILDGYGQTETTLLCGNYPGLPVKPGSMGVAAPGVHLAVIDAEGNELPADTEGDIAVKLTPKPPQGLFTCYKGAPARTEATRRGDWYLTGDRATRDADGYFWFVGRADDVILSAGYRIGPFEVESALLEHDAVMESAVVASPDPTRGEVVKAFIVLAHGHYPSDELVHALQAHVKAVTAPYKYPRKIEFVHSLPKTVSGKIKRKELRDKEWGRG